MNIKNKIPTCTVKCTVNIMNHVVVPIIRDSAPNTPRVRFAQWNARSIKAKNKSTALCDFVINQHIDLLVITETWLTGTERDNRAIADIRNTLPNFVFHHIPRLHCRGGGVGVLA